jgi:hypothetical protein
LATLGLRRSEHAIQDGCLVLRIFLGKRRGTARNRCRER